MLPLTPARPLRRPLPTAKPRRRWPWRLLRWSLILGIWLSLVAAVAIIWLARDLPRPETALDTARRPGLALLDRTGHSLAAFGDVVGDPLRLSQLPRYLPAAAVAVEDHRFWQHHGLDLLGVARAILVNLRAGHLVQGGSTLTQQVAKNLFLTNARTLRRKVQELMLTLWLEQTFSKTEILEIWLNRVYLGSGAWGMDAAAHLYFDTSARNLTLWQCAVLAGIPRAPSRLNPRTDPAAAAARGREVLNAMAETGVITRAEAAAAAASIVFPPRAVPAGWFADWVADAATPIIPPGADAILHTTLDPRLQSAAELRLRTLLDGPGTAANVTQGAVIVMDTQSGAIRAMVGGRDYRASPFNRAVAARRQPGSAFKPIVWLAALATGLHPTDTVLDAPIRIGPWSPQNFDLTYRGDVTLEDALAQSLNTVAIRLAQQAGGPQAVIAQARRLGITSPLPNDLTIALGTGDVGVLELATAYATIFNGGHQVTPTGIESAEADHHALPTPHPPQPATIDPDQAAEMLQMLTAVVSRGSGRAAQLPGRQTAGKTGTTQDSKDAWFIGQSNTTIIAIWLGNDDNHPMKNVTGGTLPARLFHDIAADLR